MKRLASLIFLLWTQAVCAADKIEMGIFSLATEAGWGASFELKKDGSADIVPAFDGEREDGSTSPNPKKKHLKASWKEVNSGIEITYLHRRDRLRFEKECKDWEEYPCFRYEKAIEGPESKSQLKFEQPYINWNWKNPIKPKPVQTPDLNRCKATCEEMSRNGVLKKGMTTEECVQATSFMMGAHSKCRFRVFAEFPLCGF